ncbi:MAG: sulfatase, partial [Myxococcota bacterium]
CALAVVVPLQHHLLVGISTEVALCMGAVAAMALVFAAFTSAFAVEGRAPVVPLVSWAALGGLLLGLLSLRPERVVLPALAEGDPIVLVVVSGLRADHTGLGSARPSVTPQLDAFGEEALVFEDAHTTSNWSVPSIASVLTGRSPYRHGAGHHDGERQRHTALQPDVDTLASALRRSGYATMAMVGDPRLRLYGLDRGFDGWVEAPKRGAVPTLWRLVEASGVAPLAWPRTVSADEVSDRAIAWVEQQAPEGWFLFVQYADAAVEGPHAAYPEAVAQADEAIGRLLDALPADAWVVIVGDRGRSLGEEHVEMLRTARGSSYGDHAYEEVTHIPLGLRLPTLVPGRMAETVSVVDVAPTILTALSHAPLPLADGVPLEPVFGLPLAPRVVTSQSSRWGLELQSVIAFDHKLMVTRDGRTRLYDRAADPYEQAPLPVGLEQDDLQRQLLSALPPPGGVRVHEDWTVRFSQLAGRLLGRR